MSHELLELKEYPVRRLDVMPRMLLVVAAGLAVLGLIGLIAGLVSDPSRAWRAYAFNWVTFAGIAQGAVVLAAVVTIARGVWSRPLRRVSLSFVAFLPIAYLILFPPLLIWAPDHLFPWLHHDVGDKALYLNMPFLTIRHIVLLAVLLVISLAFAYWALRPDAGIARDTGITGYDRLSRGWRGQEQEEQRAYRHLGKLAVAVALAYVFAYSFIAFDFVMSLDPHWLSMLIGPYVFMAAFLGGIAATAIASLLFRRHLSLHEYMEGSNLHDLGKLMFAFCVFWAYLFWSQYIVIWYGNLPHEQTFLVARMGGIYRPLSILVFFMLFVLPFFGLLGVKPKRNPGTLGFFSALIIAGLWLERYVLVYPSLYPDADRLVMGLPEVGIALLFIGLMIGSVAWFAANFPILQIWQPASEVELLGIEGETVGPPPGAPSGSSPGSSPGPMV